MLVLLDLDGTLTDPYDGITRCVSFALAGLGLPALDEPGLRAFIGPPLQDRFAALGLDEQAVDAAVALYRERFSTHGLLENRLYDGVPEAMAAMTAAGLRLAVATSKPTVFAERIVRHFGLDEHLQFVAGATLDGTRRSKADVIELALTTLGVSADDAVMVGDRAQDVAGAHAHGMECIGVAWGYGDPRELAQADSVVSAPEDLVRELLSRTLRS